MQNTARILILLSCIWSVAASASAQVVGLVGGASTQGEGKSDRPYLGPPFGGTAPALVIFVDARTTGHLSLGGEFSSALPITGTQEQRTSGGNNVFESEHRDTVISGTIKAQSSTSDRFYVAAVGGGGLGWRRTERTGEFRSDRPTVPNAPFAETVTTFVPAITGGVDVGASFGHHAGLVASGRLHVLIDEDKDQDGVVRVGVSSMVWRYGAGLRIRF